ncbi:unnamed protein product [Lampetra fluviatilis]
MAFHVAVMMMMLMLPGFVSTRVPGSHIGSSVALSAPSYEFLEEHSGSLTVDHPPPPPPLLLLHATHNPTGSHRGHARHQPGGEELGEDHETPSSRFPCKSSHCARAPCRNDGTCHETADGKWRTLTVRGEPGSFHVTMRAFVNASFDEGDLYRDGDTVMAGERVYVELHSRPRHPLIEHGCPNEPEVVLHGANGNGSTVRFSLLAFRFVSDRRQQQQQRRRVVVPLPDVYLHCLVRVCVHAKSATADLCATNCSMAWGATLSTARSPCRWWCCLLWVARHSLLSCCWESPSLCGAIGDSAIHPLLLPPEHRRWTTRE